MSATAAFIETLRSATLGAEQAEAALREEFARRVASLAEDRAFAFRRFNFVAAVTDGVGRADDAGMAAVYGIGHLRHRLDWAETDGVRGEVLERFAPVCRALFAAGRPEPDADADPAAELAAFEAWYRERVGSSFWVLFENPMPETPLVDF